MDWDLYEKRININGKNDRERKINFQKQAIQNKILASPSLKKVLIEGFKMNLVIRSTKNQNEKTFSTLPGEVVKIGNIASFENTHWIIVSVDSDHEITCNGSMLRCNFKMRYQNFTSKIMEQWCVSTNSYSETLDGGKVIRTPSGKAVFLLPYNNETRKLYKGKRLMTETAFNKTGREIGVVYKISGFDGKFYDYGENGRLIEITAENDSYSETNDNLQELVCDYILDTDAEVL